MRKSKKIKQNQKKKKGFTLIELLAVILILGIIALIAIPTVTTIIHESKKGAFRTSIKNVVRAIELKCQIQQMRGEELTTTYTFTNGKISPELEVKGKLPNSGTITVDSTCKTMVDVEDDDFKGKNPDGTDKIEITEKDPNPEIEDIGYLCIRAKELHEEECISSGSCRDDGYTKSGSKGTTTIKYGNLGIEGTLTSGDAFDCDVNGDKKFDSDTERFYYVSDYYNTTTKKFETDKAVLIYYNNTLNGSPDNTNAAVVAYDEQNRNYVESSGLVNLPKTSQWKNVSLINSNRKIITEAETYSTLGGNLPTVDYSNYSARLLTVQELEAGCDDNAEEWAYTIGELFNCNYLLENTKYSSYSANSLGYRLETPDSETSVDVGYIAGEYALSYKTDANVYFGMRPVIEIDKTDIRY